MRPSLVATAFLLLGACPAAASPPCFGYTPAMHFARVDPISLRLPADTRVICSLGRGAVLHEIVLLQTLRTFPLERVDCTGPTGCECRLPDRVAMAGAKTFQLSDGQGRPLYVFAGFQGEGRTVPCPPGQGAKEQARLDEVRLLPAIRLTPWPVAPPSTCYTLPTAPRLVPGKRYVWKVDDETSLVSRVHDQILRVEAAEREPPPGPPTLVARPASPFFGACPPYAALEFVRPGTPAPDAVPVGIASDAPELFYRWEVQHPGGERLSGPAVGFVPFAFAYLERVEGFRSPLEPGRPYRLVVRAVDALGRESSPATLDFRLDPPVPAR